MNMYRVENGNVYEYSDGAYIFYCKTYALTAKELRELKQIKV